MGRRRTGREFEAVAGTGLCGDTRQGAWGTWCLQGHSCTNCNPKKWVCDALAAWTAGWWPCVHPQCLHFARGAGPWDHNLCRRVLELLHLLQQPSFVLWKSEQLTTPPQGSKVSPTVPPAAPSHPTPILQPFLGGLLGTKRKTPRGDESWAGIGCCRGELTSRLLRKRSLWLY